MKKPGIMLALCATTIIIIAAFFTFSRERTGIAIDTSATRADVPNSITIRMTGQGYMPSKIVIKKGTEALFMNAGSNDMWPASNIHPTHEIYPEFDPRRPIPPQSSWSFIFNRQGIWYYHDHLYPKVTGSITVE